MKDAVKRKLQLLRQEAAKPESPQRSMAIRTLKKEAIEEALDEIVELGACGMRAFPEDLDWVARLVESELVCKSSLDLVKQVLFRGTDETYERMVMHFVERMQKAYGKYFRSKTQVGDSVYSPILNMYWNQELQLWERTDPDGWHTFSAYMPHAAA